MRSIFLNVFFIIFLFSISCKKKSAEEPKEIYTDMKNGLPEKPKEINGYFFSSCIDRGAHVLQCIRGYAAFNDPGQNLFAGIDHYNPNFSDLNEHSGNVDVGKAYMDTCTMTKISSNKQVHFFSYPYEYIPDTVTPHWKIQGNRTFEALDINIPRKYPVINFNQVNSVYKSKGFEIDLANGFSNYDSVRVSASWENESVTKCAIPGTAKIIFLPADLQALDGNSLNICYFAFNYCHQTRNGKIYVYEQVTCKCVSIFVYP